MITITEEKIILNYNPANLSSGLLPSDISFNYFFPTPTAYSSIKNLCWSWAEFSKLS